MDKPGDLLGSQGQEKFLESLMNDGISAKTNSPAPADKPTVESLTAELEKLQRDLEKEKRNYSESTKEALRLKGEEKRLLAEVQAYNQFDPFINALKTDKQFVDHISAYYEPDAPIEDPSMAPQFDEDALLRKVESIVMTTLQSVEEQKRQQAAKDRLEDMISTYLKSHPNKTREDVEAAIAATQSRQWTIDDVMRLSGKEEDVQPPQTAKAPQIPDIASMFRPAPSLVTQPSSSKQKVSPGEALLAGLRAFENSQGLTITE